ncbi:MAG: OmpH family outer membrane protein [Verrucomicrobiales bacterium]|nr:OmpH family outer membrane protein [Verrucomicrobiales bacterium]
MTIKNLLLTACVTTFLALSAQAQSGGVAILDIDAVARELGVEDQVRVDLITMQSDLNAELQRTQATMQAQMNNVEQGAGENPSDVDRQKVLQTNQQLNLEFNRLKNQAQQNLAQERVRMINEFRLRLEPVALMAAKKKGLDIVLMKTTPPVFTYSREVDITEETTKLAIEAGMKVELSEIDATDADAIEDAGATEEIETSGSTEAPAE